MALQSEALLGDAPLEQVVPDAMAAVKRALELDPDNGDALIARGSIETTFHWTWDAAERDLTRGIQLSPNNSYGLMMYSIYLESLGRAEDAVRQMQQAVEINPLSFFMARPLWHRALLCAPLRRKHCASCNTPATCIPPQQRWSMVGSAPSI